MAVEPGEAPTSKNWRGRFPAITDWPLWTSSPKVLTSVLIVELTAVLLTGLAVAEGLVPRLADLGMAAVLVGFGVFHTEIAVRVERARRQVGGAVHVDLTSAWTFAGALLLPPVLAAGVAILVRGHLWRRAWYPRVPLYRQVFSTSTVVLACVAAHSVVDAVTHGGNTTIAAHPIGLSQLAAIGIAVLAYTTVNSGLVAGAIVVSSAQPNLSDAIGEWEENFLEIATLCLGGITAIALSIAPFLGLFTVPVVLCLNRAVLVHQLQVAADTDAKTGLLNAVAWRNKAEQRLHQRGTKNEPGAVLVLDLDHFKDINDTHGHLAGDHVLGAVVAGLRSELRDRDIVGRFGGEEFVVFLSAHDTTTADGLQAIAERLRQRVADLRVEMPTPDGPLSITGISVSIGVAVYPEHGRDIGDLLQVADTALYAAKSAGRNAVRRGHLPPTQPGERANPTDSAPVRRPT